MEFSAVQNFNSITKTSNLSRPAWITIGCFDGVHLGHQHLIKEMINAAQMNNGESIAFTFSPHPAQYFKRTKDRFILLPHEEKIQYLSNLGIDKIITLRFDQELAACSARQFVKKIMESQNLKSLWVGYDFSLGANRSGDTSSLDLLSKELDFELKVIPPLMIKNEIISSSSIRTFLQNGDVEKSSAFLGRPFALKEFVIHGDGRGSKIGIPTANLKISEETLIPESGVYATLTTIDNQIYQSVTGVGYRPTFMNGNTIPSVETHIMDLDYNLYGKKIKVEFIKRIRPEYKFSAVEDLIDQIKKDISISQEVLSHAA
ncbi:MAG: bifunctional riboflavin kinase/FAD synthetase [Anaerolineaceae bacterium]|nr:bifunctional riboflavin kinase/FAD synthetase [Anaerolineaceae bacterium]